MMFEQELDESVITYSLILIHLSRVVMLHRVWNCFVQCFSIASQQELWILFLGEKNQSSIFSWYTSLGGKPWKCWTWTSFNRVGLKPVHIMLKRAWLHNTKSKPKWIVPLRPFTLTSHFTSLRDLNNCQFTLNTYYWIKTEHDNKHYTQHSA